MKHLCILVLLVLATLLCTTGAEALNVGDDLERKLDALSNVVVHETITRFVGNRGQAKKLDEFLAVVELADGRERYSEIRSGRRSFASSDEVAGLWSFGELATVLRVTRDSVANARETYANGERTLEFRVPASSRRWFLRIAGRIHWLDFDGILHVDPTTGEIQRIEWFSSTLPEQTGVGQVSWDVRFGQRDVGGQVFTVPERGLYRITRPGRGNRAEWNVTAFSRYERYGSDVKIQFELQ